jgi:hypothetical protein
VSLTPAQLAILLEGIDWRMRQRGERMAGLWVDLALPLFDS